ncbi:MAG: DUF2497 domain-containing protein [Pseudolabrys sp.]|jgi:cell pole-organizing protein PopZ|nr:DUF2497 domain-containing protein [Pseudolabrys sp.]
MNQPAKAQEPSMEEILASIRRIIADEDTSKAAKPAAVAPAPPPAPPAPKPVPAPPPVAAKPAPPPPPPPKPVNNQADVDAMLASMDAAPPKPEPKPEFKPAPKPPEAVTPPPAMPAADVLDLTEAMATPAPTQNFRRIDAASDVVFAEGASEPAEPPPSPVIDRSLLSNATRSAVDSAFHSLANTVLGNNARTLEDLVKEMLRPMLKSWLDDNLPGLVERIVRAEIERVSRGGR